MSQLKEDCYPIRTQQPRLALYFTSQPRIALHPIPSARPTIDVPLAAYNVSDH